ncbi:hypothetical protein ACTXPP_11360 [Candidatus Corynebacterium faecigallinarum]|uniref:hypothetical protein n=1 Tax=Candidatus Corynebacterium faecigallinarum TaxID=2838528 RepID=UPI003FD6ACAD
MTLRRDLVTQEARERLATLRPRGFIQYGKPSTKMQLSDETDTTSMGTKEQGKVRIDVDFRSEDVSITSSVNTKKAKFPINIVFPDERRFGHLELIEVMKAAEQEPEISNNNQTMWELDLSDARRNPSNNWPTHYRFNSVEFADAPRSDRYLKVTFDSDLREMSNVVDSRGRVIKDLGGVITSDDFNAFEHTLDHETRSAMNEGFEVYGTWTISWLGDDPDMTQRPKHFTESSEREIWEDEFGGEDDFDIEDDIFDDDEDDEEEEEDLISGPYKCFVAVIPCRFVGKPQWTPNWE